MGNPKVRIIVLLAIMAVACFVFWWKWVPPGDMQSFVVFLVERGDGRVVCNKRNFDARALDDFFRIFKKATLIPDRKRDDPDGPAREKDVPGGGAVVEWAPDIVIDIYSDTWCERPGWDDNHAVQLCYWRDSWHVMCHAKGMNGTGTITGPVAVEMASVLRSR